MSAKTSRQLQSHSHVWACQSWDKTILSWTPLGQKSFVPHIIETKLGTKQFCPRLLVNYKLLFLINRWSARPTIKTQGSSLPFLDRAFPPSSPPCLSRRSGMPPPSISCSRSRCSHSRPSRRCHRRSPLPPPPNRRGDSIVPPGGEEFIGHRIYRQRIPPDWFCS